MQEEPALLFVPILVDGVEPSSVETAGPPLDPVNFVAFVEEELR
jgi:hypothetical protein